MFSTIPPSIKLCDQQSFRLSDERGKRKKWLLKCLGTTRLYGGAEQRLLYRRGNRIGDGNGRLTDEVDERLGKSAQEDVDDSLFKGGEVVDVDDV